MIKTMDAGRGGGFSCAGLIETDVFVENQGGRWPRGRYEVGYSKHLSSNEDLGKSQSVCD